MNKRRSKKINEQTFQEELSWDKIWELFSDFRYGNGDINKSTYKEKFEIVFGNKKPKQDPYVNKRNSKKEKQKDDLGDKWELDDKLTEDLFQRFKNRGKGYKDSISWYDLLVALTILSFKLQQEDKERLLFKITDQDQDNCLSLVEIEKMVNSINRTFMYETSLFDIASPMLLEEHAKKQAAQQLQWIKIKIKWILEENGDEEKNLITDLIFSQALKRMKEIGLKLIPTAFMLDKVLANKKVQEKEFVLFSEIKDKWWFRTPNGEWQEKQVTSQKKEEFKRYQDKAKYRHDLISFKQELYQRIWGDREEVQEKNNKLQRLDNKIQLPGVLKIKDPRSGKIIYDSSDKNQRGVVINRINDYNEKEKEKEKRKNKNQETEDDQESESMKALNEVNLHIPMHYRRLQQVNADYIGRPQQSINQSQRSQKLKFKSKQKPQNRKKKAEFKARFLINYKPQDIRKPLD